MIFKGEFLNQLRQFFGLNLYEVKIWAALLSRGVSTAGELSDISNVPRSRAYDILESLEKKGFVVMKLGKPIKYIAVEPGEVVERVKKSVKMDAEEHAKKLEELKGTPLLNELETLHKQGIDFIEPSDLSGAIRGRHNLYAHLETMLKGASKSVTLVTTSKGLMREADTLKSTFEKLKKKGVKIRIAAPLGKDHVNLLRDLSKYAEVKHAESLDARFCIVDNKEVMFMVLNDDNVHPSYDIGIWVNSPFFASALDGMFNSVWKDMKAK